MTRAQLEHLIRAAGAITGSNPILVLGSQSILGRFPSPPPELAVSMEADLCPLDAPEAADVISGSIGEITVFQDTFGYYAHGLPPDACVLPDGWRTRLVAIESPATRGYTGLCLDPADLACAKLVAGRPKDLDFVAGLVRHSLVDPDGVRTRIGLLPRPEDRTRAEGMLALCLRPR